MNDKEGKKRKLTRRDFIRGTAGATMLASMGFPFAPKGGAEEVPKARVVLVRDKNVLDEKGNIDGEVVRAMVDRAVTELTGKKDILEAWKQVVRVGDIVGIKSNSWEPLRTPPEVERAIHQRVLDVGIKEEHIGIGDRGVLRDPLFQDATALINARPLRIHHWSGIGGVIKNYIMFTPKPPDYHENACENLAALWDLPIVKGKTRLNLLVLFTPQFHGVGPHHFDPEFTWPYKGILAGRDPVAVDAVGLRILKAQRLRHFGEEKPLKPPVRYLAAAENKYRLGCADLSRIDVVKVGWKEGILI
jgi:hypothetical protein